MKNYLLIFLLIIAFCGCKITHFSSGGTLRNGLKNNIDSFFQDNSTEIAKTYQKYDAVPPDTALIGQIRKFDKGFYVVKMKEVEKPYKEEAEKNEFKGKVEVNTTEKKFKDVLLTLYEVDNRLDLSFSDKLIYIIFLDNERVLYHSPYRNNFLKTGEAERVNFENIPKRNSKGILKKQVRFMRKTITYFKLGDINYDYNSVMKGYYKIKKDSIVMWFEKGIDKKGKIKLLKMDFAYKLSKTNDSTKLKVDALSFKNAMINNKPVDIDSTFNSNKKLEDSTYIKFEYQAKEFRLLLVSNKVKFTKTADSIDYKDTEKFIIKEIDSETNKRTYKVKVKDKRNVIKVEESLDDIYTF